MIKEGKRAWGWYTSLEKEVVATKWIPDILNIIYNKHRNVGGPLEKAIHFSL